MKIKGKGTNKELREQAATIGRVTTSISVSQPVVEKNPIMLTWTPLKEVRERSIKEHECELALIELRHKYHRA